ncbi:hypothetical protein [Hymenobacter edaphi]|uniref:Uncharacterized protein n=1 Tax=Hymenobacter edaphi TaxID=2211146 RepID=A0A328BUX5_9BACT|nr:hypothetical protein [Hymenobacter edaphi]RAK70331.1 hypothetical protein DLM85_05665 [Hymenobacter edaphi]
MNRLYLYAALLLLTQCSKCKDDPQPKNPEDALPAATQEGKNTFGCLVNGQAWTPKGSLGGVPNFYVSYDPTYAGGTIDIRAYRLPNSDDSRRQRITLGGGDISHVGTYALVVSDARGASFYDDFRPSSCQEYRSADPLVHCQGTLTLTRLDAAVASGTFEFVLAKPGCDTIKVTQGRFDRKL